MANEIKREVRLSWSKNGAQIIADVSETLDQTNSNTSAIISSMADVSKELPIGDVTGQAYLMFKNIMPAWSALSATDQSNWGSRSNYETQMSIYIGTTDPCTPEDSLFNLKPQAGTTMLTSTLSWFGIRGGEGASELLIVAIET